MPEVKKAILAVTGYDAAAVDLAATNIDFVVTLVNSKLASGSNAARENEASKIASVIADAISGKGRVQRNSRPSYRLCNARSRWQPHPDGRSRSISVRIRRAGFCITSASPRALLYVIQKEREISGDPAMTLIANNTRLAVWIPWCVLGIGRSSSPSPSPMSRAKKRATRANCTNGPAISSEASSPSRHLGTRSVPDYARFSDFVMGP